MKIPLDCDESGGVYFTDPTDSSYGPSASKSTGPKSAGPKTDVLSVQVW